MNPDYPRDLVGYGRTPPRAGWPSGAKLALQFVINYEEGGENSILDGDPASELVMRGSSALPPRLDRPRRHRQAEVVMGQRQVRIVVRVRRARRLPAPAHVLHLLAEPRPPDRKN